MASGGGFSTGSFEDHYRDLSKRVERGTRSRRALDVVRTENRPPADLVGPGAQRFDASLGALGKLIISNGTIWVDAMGNPA